jgi:hydroxymethylbilane synthase
LGEDPEVVDTMSVEQMVPQVGQGALAIECRAIDSVAIAGLAKIGHSESLSLFECERAFLRELGGDCSLPAGAHAVLDGDTISLTGFLASEDLSRSHQSSVTGTNSSELGTNLAIDLSARLG